MSAAKRSAVLLTVATAFALAWPASAETRPPVPLHTPPLETPVEAGGTGLAPEVTVSVRVDRRGRPAQVNVERISPSSERDALFEAATRETLSLWRYLPAMEDGEPVETTLHWVVQFPRRSESGAALGPFFWRGLAQPGGQDQHEAEEILALPPAQRRQIRDGIAEDAEHFFVRKTTEQESFRFRVIAEAEPPTTRAIAGNLEAIFNALHELLGAHIAPQPEPYKIVVHIHHRQGSFLGMVRAAGGPAWVGGFYMPAGFLAFHLEYPSGESLLSVLFHEATHAYLDRYVCRPGVGLPIWLNEGFAEYVGNSNVKDGKLQPGTARKKETYQHWWGRRRAKSQVLESLEELKRAMKKNELPSLARFVEMNQTAFYSDSPQMNYTMGWAFVHYLRHGQDGWDEGAFPRFMLYVAEGYPALDALQMVYGDLAGLEDGFREHVRRF